MRRILLSLVLPAVLVLALPGTSGALEKCSHVYSFLGATQGTVLTFWMGEQCAGSCSPYRLEEGFRLHQLLLRGRGVEKLTTRLKEDYPDWLALESWLAKSGALKTLRFEMKEGDWALDLGEELLVLQPPKGDGAPGILNRKTSLVHRVAAGPGGEIIEKAWYLPAVRMVFLITRAAGPEDATLQGFALMKIRESASRKKQ